MMILCRASNLALQATSFRSTSLDHPRSTRFGNINVALFLFRRLATRGAANGSQIAQKGLRILSNVNQNMRLPEGILG